MEKTKFEFNSIEECDKFLEKFYQDALKNASTSSGDSPRKNSTPLTERKIMDNSQANHDKKNIGVRMKHHNDSDPNRWHVHIQSYGEVLQAGSYDEENISSMGIIAIAQSWYYLELINGRWVYVPNNGAVNAPAGQYFPSVRIAWRSNKNDGNKDDISLDFSTVTLKDNN